MRAVTVLRGVKVQAGISPQHVVAAGYVLLAERSAAAQQFVELYKHVAQQLTHVPVGAFDKDAGATAAYGGPAGCGQQLKMRIVRAKQLVG